MVYDNEEAIQMIEVLGECQRNFRAAERLWRERYPERTAHSRHVFSRLSKRVLRNGIIQPDHNKGRKIRRRIRDDRTVDMLASVEVNPHDSIRQRSRDSGLSRSSIQRILKESKLHPYRMPLLHALSPDDLPQRLVFCRWIQNQRPLFCRSVLFSDECTFKSDGEVNTWNFRFWSSANPHWVREVDQQHVWKVNVWCGIINDKIVGPIFIENNLNGANHVLLIEDQLAHLLEELPRRYRIGMWFQQDGCPAHTSRITRNILNTMFPGRWIGKYGPVAYPPRSPDLTPLDYYLWGRIKELVYINRPTTREDMKQRIRDAIASSDPAEIRRAVDSFERRVDMCVRLNGGHIEHLY